MTGGGGGIGSAICRRLATEGVSVIITYSRSQAKAEALAQDLEGEGHLVMQAPVDDSLAQEKLAGAISEKYGKLDILVNNAGITQPVAHADLDSFSDDLIDRIFHVNGRGAIASIRAMKSLLLEGDDALVINITSIAALSLLRHNYDSPPVQLSRLMAVAL